MMRYTAFILNIFVLLNKNAIAGFRSMFRTKETKGKDIAGAVALFTAAVVVLAGFAITTSPKTHNHLYSYEQETQESFEFPLKIAGDRKGIFSVRFTLDNGFIPTKKFHIVPDDCLESLEINGAAVQDVTLPFCDYTNGRTFDLSAYLQPGENTVLARIRNDGGDTLLRFDRAWSDLTIFLPLTLLPLFVGFLLIFLYTRVRPEPSAALLSLIIIAAVCVRIFYMLTTPYWIRGHDTDGHIEYIDYIAEHWNIPAPNAGWEFWQPPLYYTLGAVWSSAGAALGFSRIGQLFSLQVLALLLSLITFGLCVWMGHLLFDKRERPYALLYFTAFLGFMPGLIFNAARINNDVLALTFAFAVLALLLRWWKQPSMGMWIAIAILIGLHLLTKNTGLLLLPVVLGSLVFKKDFSWKKKILDGGIFLLVVVLISGWFSAYRHFHNTDQDMIVGNTGTLNSGLLLTNSLSSFLVFNPVKVVTIPYNNPWDDAARRQYFWEYWYRSAFFGEFHFGDDRKLMGSWILFWSMLTGIIAISGCIWALRRRFRDTLPLLFTTLIFALGHAAFRMEYPYGSSQDFRYSLIVLIPIAYYTAMGIVTLKSPVAQKMAGCTVQTFLVLCVMFLLHF